jgi:hypothetical protein
MGRRERGDDGRAAAQRCRSYGATAGGDRGGGGHDYGNHHADSSTGAYPHQW